MNKEIVEYDDELSKAQKNRLSKMDPDNIPSGANVSTEFLNLTINDGDVVLNIGCGRGKKVKTMTSELSVKPNWVIGIDINEVAIDMARSDNQNSSIDYQVADVTDESVMTSIVSQYGLANIVVAEGLFANLIHWDAAYALTNINRSSVSGGRLLVADCLRADQIGGSNLLIKKFQNNQSDYQHWIDQWKYVYQENGKFFGSTSKYHFIVFDPSIKDRWLRSYAEIYSHWRSNNYERISRHWDFELFKKLCITFGYEFESGEFAVWYGRAQEPILGFVGCFRKVWDIGRLALFNPIQSLYLALSNGFAAGRNEVDWKEALEKTV